MGPENDERSQEADSRSPAHQDYLARTRAQEAVGAEAKVAEVGRSGGAAASVVEQSFKGVKCQSVDAEIARQRSLQRAREEASLESRGAAERDIVEALMRAVRQQQHVSQEGKADTQSGEAAAVEDQAAVSPGETAGREGCATLPPSAVPPWVQEEEASVPDGASPRYRSHPLSATGSSRENSPRVLQHHVIAVCGSSRPAPRLRPAADRPVEETRTSGRTDGKADGECAAAAGAHDTSAYGQGKKADLDADDTLRCLERGRRRVSHTHTPM